MEDITGQTHLFYNYTTRPKQEEQLLDDTLTQSAQ